MKHILYIALATLTLIIAGCGEKPPANSPAVDKAVKETEEAGKAMAAAAQNSAAAALDTASQKIGQATAAGASAAQHASAEGRQAADQVISASKDTANSAASIVKEATHDAATATAAAAEQVAVATQPATMPDWIKPPTYDCRTCHAIDKKVVGPAWKAVAQKYKGDPTARAMLIEKVRKGGNGHWNEVTGGIKMTPHPNLSDAELEKAVNFVLSLQ